MKKILLSILIISVAFLTHAQIVYFPVTTDLDEATIAGGNPANEDYYMFPNDHVGGIPPIFFQSQMGGGTFNVQILMATAADGGIDLCGAIAGLMNFPYALNSGDAIGSSSNWLSGPYPNGSTSFTLWHKSISPLLPGQSAQCALAPFLAGTSNKYVGLRFASNGSAIHYGWAEVSVNSAGDIVTIHGWAYETALNTPILAGATSGSGVTNVTSITVTGQGGATIITAAGGALQMEAAILPVDATNSTVTWSVADVTGSATINTTGMLTAVADGVVEVTATANDASGISGSAFITLSSGSTSIDELGNTLLKVYPNPTNGMLNIETGSTPNKVIVYDMIGTKVREINPTDAKFVIDLSAEANGVYFMKVYTANGVQMERITLR